MLQTFNKALHHNLNLENNTVKTNPNNNNLNNHNNNLITTKINQFLKTFPAHNFLNYLLHLHNNKCLLQCLKDPNNHNNCNKISFKII